MIRKLRLKFICVNMLIVTLMLTAIFGMVYHLTRQGLETQSEAMLQSVASDAFHPNRPGSPPQEVHCCFANKLRKIFIQSAKKKRRLKGF